ncbi:phosphotransferase family protein [Nocardia sp. NPDC004711]
MRAWMDEQGIGIGELTGFEAISGGTQNVMIRFNRSGQSYVLRRGPVHARSDSNRTIEREMRLLRALRGTPVPHASFIAGAVDPGLMNGHAFYLMEAIDGVNAAISLPDVLRSDAARTVMAMATIDALVALGDLDHAAIGLAEFGKPAGFLERQVPQWMARLESYCQDNRYDGVRPEQIRTIADWLERNRPGESIPGVIHGDFHIGNVMFAPSAPELVAIVDWEMATIGDPLLDLGWLLSVWPSPDDEEDLLGTVYSRAGGLPTEHDLVARYAAGSRRSVDAIDWYVVLAAFKFAVVLEGTYARAKAGDATAETGERLHRVAGELFARACRRISSI